MQNFGQRGLYFKEWCTSEHLRHSRFLYLKWIIKNYVVYLLRHRPTRELLQNHETLRDQ